MENDDFSVKLVSRETCEPAHMSKSPRVGLSLSKCKNSRDERLSYIMRPYRYCTTDFDNEVKKYKCLVALSNGYGIKKDWKTSFEQGKTRKFSYFKENGILSVSYLCEFYGFWIENYKN